MAAVLTTLWNAQTEVLTAQTAQINATAARLTDYAEAATICGALTAENSVLAALTNDREFYTLRQAAIDSHAQVLSSLLDAARHQALIDLQYNGIELDLELVRFYLFGKAVAVAPKL